MSIATSFGRWSCPACTFSNVSATLKCEVCQTSRIGQVKASPIPSMNTPYLSVQSKDASLGADQASANFASSPTVPLTPSPTPSQSIHSGVNNNHHNNNWSCNVCSLSNSPTVGRCAACDTVRPAVIGGGGGNSTVPANSVIMPVRAASSSSARITPRTPSPAMMGNGAAGIGNHAAPPVNSLSRASSITLQPGQYQCQSCTFINTTLLPACEVCGVARQGVSGSASSSSLASVDQQLAAGVSNSAASSSSTWHCKVCTVLNPIDAVRCSMCRAVSPLAPRAAEPIGPTVPLASARPRTARGQVVPVLARQSSEHRSERNPQVGGASGLVPPRTVGMVLSSAASSGASLTSGAQDAMIDPTGERQAAEQWQEIMSICSATGNAFIDDSFRPGDRSIYGSDRSHFADHFWSLPEPNGSGAMRPARQRGPYAWKRGRAATKESAAPWCILPFTPDGAIDVQPEDIRQGELGDCWLCSALSVLAERPRLIEHLLLTQELNDVGAYQVRFCKDGRWVTITVDDYFPVSPVTGKLAFSHSPGNELWVALIEKAYAKLHGSYQAIESGSISDAFAELTGAPSERIHLHLEDASKFEAIQAMKVSGGDVSQYNDVLWATILSFRSSKFLMGASCGRKNAQTEEYTAVGLRNDHAYAILRCEHINGIQLLCLRNPWGSSSWTGAWSQGSKEWTKEWRARLNYPEPPVSAALGVNSLGAALYQVFAAPSTRPGAGVKKHSSEGIFWICFADFLKYFRTIDVCKYQDDWHVMRLRDEFPLQYPPQPQAAQSVFGAPVPVPSAATSLPIPQQRTPWTSQYMYELTIPASTWCFISLIQQDLRGSQAPVPHKYKSLGLFLLKSSSTQPIETHLSSYQRCNEVFPETQRSMTCETLLTDAGGRYLLLPCSYGATIASAEGGSASAASSATASFPFILCVYSAHPVLIKRRAAYLPALTIGKQLACLSLGESKPLGEYCTLYTFNCQGGLWFVVVNRHPTKYLSITLDCSRSSGLLPSRGSHLGAQAFKTKDFVPPKHRQLLLALVTPTSSSGYTYERACTYIHLDGVSGQLHTPILRRGYDVHQPVIDDRSFVPTIV